MRFIACSSRVALIGIPAEQLLCFKLYYHIVLLQEGFFQNLSTVIHPPTKPACNMKPASMKHTGLAIPEVQMPSVFVATIMAC